MNQIFKLLDDPSFDLVRKRATLLFEAFCKANDLSIIATDIDRYGAVEWSAYRRDTVNRYLSLFLAFVGEEGARAPIVLECWYTVDNMKHYLRRRPFPPRRVSSYYFHSSTSALPERLSESWHAAEAVEKWELVEPILMPVYGKWPERAKEPSLLPATGGRRKPPRFAD